LSKPFIVRFIHLFNDNNILNLFIKFGDGGARGVVLNLHKGGCV